MSISSERRHDVSMVLTDAELHVEWRALISEWGRRDFGTHFCAAVWANLLSGL